MASWSTSSSKRSWDSLKGSRIPGTLGPEFFARDTLTVARELLGKLIVARSRAGITVARIVETEAYIGEDDPACHAARGETPRTRIMYGDPGRAYVYFIYGMYEMLNFVTERKGFPAAVLVRAAEPVHGFELMQTRRPKASPAELTSGPGRLCRAMGIKMAHKGERLDGPKLFVVDDGCEPKGVKFSSRIGISVGTEHPWRFFVDGNPFVSKAPQNARARALRAG